MTSQALASPPAAGALSRARAWLATEAGVARTALGFVALHVADDSFLQPQPGTSPTDHLAGGLIPIAVLAGVAWLYPRLRAGLRAVAALLLGFFGILTSIEGLYYTAKIEASGDDYTGFLALGAGLVLIGLGVVTLWKSRKRGDSLLRSSVRRILLAAGAGVVALFVLFPVSYGYVLTHVARPIVPPAQLGADYENVQFRTSDGLTLHGWYVPSKNGAAVIAFPGRRGPQKHARMLVRHGYGVLLFDRRGEGESDGDPNQFGWAGDRDVNAAVDYLKTRDDVRPGRIGAIGLSVGGEVLLQAAARSTGLAAVVSDGAGMRSHREALDLDGSMRPVALATWAIATPATALFGNDLPPPSLKDLVPRIAPRPVFFIYAGRKPSGGEELNEKFYAAAGQPKALWRIANAAHTGGITAQPREYERRVIGFFDRALLPASAP